MITRNRALRNDFRRAGELQGPSLFDRLCTEAIGFVC